MVLELQSSSPELASGKSAGMLRLEKFREALPSLVTVTVRGLSVLVRPTAVVAKFSVGGVA